jgi:hypothetical protein
MHVMKTTWLVLCALLWGTVPAAAAPARVQPCAPCGQWQLDPSASEPVQPAIDAALSRYKEPRRRPVRAPRGDIVAETQAEFENSLDEPVAGPGRRTRLREELARLLRAPDALELSSTGADVLIQGGGGARRFTPGEPHARVDGRGTARISAQWRGKTLSIAETYDRRTSNREVYAIEGNTLVVTRTIERQGLPDVTVRSVYVPR